VQHQLRVAAECQRGCYEVKQSLQHLTDVVNPSVALAPFHAPTCHSAFRRRASQALRELASEVARFASDIPAQIGAFVAAHMQVRDALRACDASVRGSEQRRCMLGLCAAVARSASGGFACAARGGARARGIGATKEGIDTPNDDTRACASTRLALAMAAVRSATS
jgi:hypothetical protein